MDGVAAVVLPVPPVAVVYHIKVFPVDAAAVSGTVAVPWQYVTGDVTTGFAGLGYTVIVKGAVLLQPFSVAVVVIVAVIWLAEGFNAVNVGIVLPVPLAESPIEVLLLDQVNVAPGVALVIVSGPTGEPAHTIKLAGVTGSGVCFISIDDVVVVVPHSFVAATDIV